MKNTLNDLNNILFAELERLEDEELTGDALKNEIERARMMAKVGEQIIHNGSLILEAQKLVAEHYSSKLLKVPDYILCEKG